MAQYSYQAINHSGQTTKGVVEASSDKEATAQLRSQGLLITNLGAHAVHQSLFSSLTQKIPTRERIIFTRQLSVMIKAGLPLMQALEALDEQTENQHFKKIIKEIAQDVKGGATLSKCMAKHPNVFPLLYTNVIQSGERSGKMEEVLNNLADQLEKDAELVARIRGAMIYPIVVLIALFAVIMLIIFFIIPQLTAVFAEMGGTLPITTRILLSASSIIRKYFIVVLIVIVLIVLAMRRWIKTNQGQMIWDTFKLRMPLFGLLIKKIYMARFTRTLAMLISAGLPMLDAIETVKNVMNNAVYTKSLEKILADVENGSPLSNVLKQDKNFPPMVAHLVSTGEQSGKLDYVLTELANFYDRDVENSTRNLSSLIEPLLMIIIGIGVGFVVISVISPIYSLSNTIN